MEIPFDEWVARIAMDIRDYPDDLSLLFGFEDIPIPTGIVKRILPLLDLLLCDGFVLEIHGKCPFLIGLPCLSFLVCFYCYFYFNRCRLLFFCFMFDYKPNNATFF
jgi:hypothetical protein